MFAGQSIRAGFTTEGVVEVCFDAREESVNKLDSRTVEELRTVTAAIASDRCVRGILVTSAKETFIVGADIFEFPALFGGPPAAIEAYLEGANAVFSGFEDLQVPIVAALNGQALGGGLEMALAADGRIMSEAALVGLPEAALGLFPGFGGTVRLPRLAGTAVAIEWIGGGRPQSAASARAAGVVDGVADPRAVREEAMKLLLSLIESGNWRSLRQRRSRYVAAASDAFTEAKRRLADAAAHQPAALAAVELMERSVGCTRDEALRLERRAFARVAKTQAAASLIQLFINDQAIRKKAKAYGKLAPKVRRVAILGAGIMGGGIAYTSAVKGMPAVMKDVRRSALEAGIAEAKRLLAKQVQSGRLTLEKAESVLANIQPTLEYEHCSDVDIVVEAVVEDLTVKKLVLAEVEGQVEAETIIASNTSSLAISELGGALRDPGRFVGMHFFNPVPQMPLVEVIRGARTSERAVATAAAYASALDKTPVVVRECPGFLVNRILMPYMLAFLVAVRDGADYEEVDRVMETFGWPMGPAYLQDVVGMDTFLRVLEVICAGFPQRMSISFRHAVDLLVKLGRLGQKSGSGYYRYESDPQGRPLRRSDPRTAALLSGLQPTGRQRMSGEALIDRLMLPLVIEAVRCLEEGIVDTAAEVDMSLVLGLGFPRHLGGPLKYADWLGMRQVVDRCERYAALGPLYAPTDGMRAAAKHCKAFY